MATVTYVTQVLGELEEARTAETSAGAADAQKIPSTNAAGVLDPSLLNATDASAGPSSAGKVVKLASTGYLDDTVLPPGVGAEVKAIQCSEDLSAGSWVNEYYSGGNALVRLADASNGRRAHAFVRASYTTGQMASCWFTGVNDQQSGCTPGATQFLGAAGASTETAPTTAGHISQQLGVAVSATEVAFGPSRPITLA